MIAKALRCCTFLRIFHWKTYRICLFLYKLPVSAWILCSSSFDFNDTKGEVGMSKEIIRKVQGALELDVAQSYLGASASNTRVLQVSRDRFNLLMVFKTVERAAHTLFTTEKRQGVVAQLTAVGEYKNSILQKSRKLC